MRGTSGLALIGIGVLHTIFGVAMGTKVLTRIAQAPFTNENTRQLVSILGREFVFWFLFGGFMMILLGHLFIWLERRLNHRTPSFVGWELLILSLCGIAVMPISGFWLVFALAIYIIVSARSAHSSNIKAATNLTL